MKKNFSDTGYTIIRNAINKDLFKNIQQEIYKTLNIKGKSQNEKYSKFALYFFEYIFSLLKK